MRSVGGWFLEDHVDHDLRNGEGSSGEVVFYAAVCVHFLFCFCNLFVLFVLFGNRCGTVKFPSNIEENIHASSYLEDLQV